MTRNRILFFSTSPVTRLLFKFKDVVIMTTGYTTLP